MRMIRKLSQNQLQQVLYKAILLREQLLLLKPSNNRRITHLPVAFSERSKYKQVLRTLSSQMNKHFLN